jgi:hypothetical protein
LTQRQIDDEENRNHFQDEKTWINMHKKKTLDNLLMKRLEKPISIFTINISGTLEIPS